MWEVAGGLGLVMSASDQQQQHLRASTWEMQNLRPHLGPTEARPAFQKARREFVGAPMLEEPSSKGTRGSEIPGLGGQTASPAAKRVSGLRKGGGVLLLLSTTHTHACAHARMHANICPCIYISMRAHPHTIHMHTLSPEVERPPQALGGPSSSPPQRG